MAWYTGKAQGQLYLILVYATRWWVSVGRVELADKLFIFC
jgi:hypothetical protein